MDFAGLMMRTYPVALLKDVKSYNHSLESVLGMLQW